MISKTLPIPIDVLAKRATRITQVIENAARIKYSLRNDPAVSDEIFDVMIFKLMFTMPKVRLIICCNFHLSENDYIRFVLYLMK